MKIALLNDSFPPLIDGVATTVLNYAEILTEMGDEVIVATPKYPDADYSHYPFKVLPYQSINTKVITAGYRMGNAYSPTAMAKLREFKPDIIHAHCPFSSLLLARHVRALTKAPVIFTYHTKFDVEFTRATRIKTISKTLVKGMCSFIGVADEVWTVSEGAGRGLVSLGYKGTYKVMNNGVDFPKGSADPALVHKVTDPYDLPADVPLYMFVGRMFSYKGLPIIIDALHHLAEDGKDFRMIFIGEGADAPKMKKMVEDYQLEDKIKFIGKVTDRNSLRAWYTRADLFLFPSTYDTNGIVVREAAACGLASVLIRNSCASEGITDSVNGYLIEENAGSLYQKLLELGNNLEEMQKTGVNAMNGIYLSWHDAVRIARENYVRVISESKYQDD